MNHAPTTEQEAIIAAAAGTEDNLLVDAFAGTGKTTTLEMIESAVKAKPILYLCFNNRVAKEAEKRMASTTLVRTFNSIGHRTWAQGQNKKLSLNDKKNQDILRVYINELPKPRREAIWERFWEIIAGVRLAKAMGYVPNGKFPNAKRLTTQATLHEALDEAPDEIVADAIDEVLVRSIQAAYDGSIDFNDQVYMPALFGGVFPKFPLVKVDEVQDLNPANHALLERLVKRRVIAIGDEFQSIYAFRGAVRGGMAALGNRYSCHKMDLSISFRCPRAIVENARWRVPQFKWIKEGGHVEHLHRLSPADIGDNATILCRNNAPLFAVAMRLLAEGRSVAVTGSDIGPKLIAMMRKLGEPDMSRADTIAAIIDWLAERLAKGSTTARDLADCMKVFATHGATLGQAINYAEHLFKQQGTISLMTGHKAKGLEFLVVYHLDPWLCGGDEQDLNLRYVIQTRSLDQYYEIDSTHIEWRY